MQNSGEPLVDTDIDSRIIFTWCNVIQIVAFLCRLSLRSGRNSSLNSVRFTCKLEIGINSLHDPSESKFVTIMAELRKKQ